MYGDGAPPRQIDELNFEAPGYWVGLESLNRAVDGKRHEAEAVSHPFKNKLLADMQQSAWHPYTRQSTLAGAFPRRSPCRAHL